MIDPLELVPRAKTGRGGVAKRKNFLGTKERRELIAGVAMVEIEEGEGGPYVYGVGGGPAGEGFEQRLVPEFKKLG